MQSPVFTGFPLGGSPLVKRDCFRRPAELSSARRCDTSDEPSASSTRSMIGSFHRIERRCARSVVQISQQKTRTLESLRASSDRLSPTRAPKSQFADKEMTQRSSGIRLRNPVEAPITGLSRTWPLPLSDVVPCVAFSCCCSVGLPERTPGCDRSHIERCVSVQLRPLHRMACRRDAPGHRGVCVRMGDRAVGDAFARHRQGGATRRANHRVRPSALIGRSRHAIVLYLSGVAARTGEIASTLRDSPVSRSATPTPSQDEAASFSSSSRAADAVAHRFPLAKRARLHLSSRLLALADVVDADATSVAILLAPRMSYVPRSHVGSVDLALFGSDWARRLTTWRRN